MADVRETVKALLTSAEWLAGLKEYKKRDITKERPDIPALQKLIKREGLPPLVFVEAAQLENGPIPRSDNKVALTLAEKIDVENAFVFFVSHRWIGQGPNATPDDPNNTKAKALFNFAQWFEVFWHGKTGRDMRKVYFWIDYAGIDQLDADKRSAGINCLPLYVSACGGMIELMDESDQFHNHGYYTRSWCLLEAALAFRFQLAGAAPFIVPFHWKFEMRDDENPDDPKSFAKQYFTKIERKLINPLSGELSDPKDRDYIVELLQIVDSLRGLRFKNREQPTALVWGVTGVQARFMINRSEV